MVQPLRKLLQLKLQLLVAGTGGSPCVMRIVKATIAGSGSYQTKLVNLHLAHAKVKPPLCRLHSSVCLVDLLLQDLLGVGLLGHVGGHELVPIGLGGEDVIGPAASHGNDLAHGLLLVNAVVRDVGH